MKNNKTVDILKLLRGEQGQVGLKIIKVNTTDPDPITVVFEGTPLALDLDIFEVPVSCYPLRKNDRLIVFPMVSQVGTRWGVISKLTGGVTMATMTGPTSCRVDGIGRDYTAQDLIIPPYLAVGNEDSNGYLLKNSIRALQAGDRVSLAPTWEDNKIKYVILQRG